MHSPVQGGLARWWGLLCGISDTGSRDIADHRHRNLQGRTGGLCKTGCFWRLSLMYQQRSFRSPQGQSQFKTKIMKELAFKDITTGIFLIRTQYNSRLCKYLNLDLSFPWCRNNLSSIVWVLKKLNGSVHPNTCKSGRFFRPLESAKVGQDVSKNECVTSRKIPCQVGLQEQSRWSAAFAHASLSWPPRPRLGWFCAGGHVRVSYADIPSTPQSGVYDTSWKTERNSPSSDLRLQLMN